MKKFFLVASLWLGLSGAVWAMSVQEQLVSSLRQQGYSIVEEGYTFLGRLRIVATKGNIRREIVVNPGTGEILRDYVLVVRSASSSSDSDARSTASASAPGDTGEPTASRAVSPVASAGQPGGDGGAPALVAPAKSGEADSGEAEIDLGSSIGAIVDEPALTLEAVEQ